MPSLSDLLHFENHRRLLQLRRDHEHQAAVNAARIRAVAARLPASRSALQEGPDSREAATPARATASTTTTHAGGPSGCSTQSA